MEESDKLAVATLAAGRCAASGLTSPKDYVAAYAEIEVLFRGFREEQDRERTAKSAETWKKL